jgi:hypothetical protein
MLPQRVVGHNCLPSEPFRVTSSVNGPRLSSQMVRRASSVPVALLIIAALLLGLSSPSFSQPSCRVADPSGTPLNVRASPNGHIVGKLKNGDVVSILDRASDGNGKTWVYIGDDQDKRPIGWVYRNFVECDQTQSASKATCLVMHPSSTP